jgi:nucleoside-diphosphate-sugar epimerase
LFPAFDSGEFHPTYVDGVVDAIIAIVEEPAPAGTIFNIGDARPILLCALRTLIAEVLRVRPRTIVIPASITSPFAGIAQRLFALMGSPMPLLAEANLREHIQ